nr:N-6 DNA methylase [Chryseobacterium glaciei]
MKRFLTVRKKSTMLLPVIYLLAILCFDLSFSRGGDEAKKQATRSIHNYFFLKGSDMLREGGILAFITSQGVLNSPKNEPIRRALMRDCNLVSAVRLPNNLFTEHAGTEVGSDLIILQKNSLKHGVSEAEELFCESRLTEYQTTGNAFFHDNKRIIHTSSVLGTDPYGQPALSTLTKMVWGALQVT